MPKHTEVTPEGWEDVVMALKGQVDNPWAVVNAMVNKGYQRHAETGAPHDPSAMLRRLHYEAKTMESLGMTTLGQTLRK